MEKRAIRWWPLWLVAAAAIGVQIWIWGFGDRTGQGRVMLAMAAVLGMLFLGMVWLLLLSRIPWRRRLGLFGVLMLVGVLLGSSLQFRGVSGDLVPILEWRWAGTSEQGGNPELGALAGPIGDYPQFLGPNRDGRLSGLALGRDWEATPPREVWRRSVGESWSGFAVVGSIAVTQEQREGDELVVAYKMDTGEKLWEHSGTGRYESGIGGVGPRATPTILEGRVYTYGALGRLNALELDSGRLIWTHDLAAEFSSKAPEWGRSPSPLLIDGLVVVPVGGSPNASLVAFSADDGALEWKGGNDAMGYASPVEMTLAGRRQIVVFNQRSVAGHDVGTGEQLWSYPWSYDQPNVAVPVAVSENRVLFSSGYGTGSKLLELVPEGAGLGVQVVWESPRLKAKFTNPVEYDGYVYGLDDGVLVCLDPTTGERCWKKGRYGHGQVVLVDDLLLVTSEKGDVALVEPNPQEFRELTRFKAFDGKTWNPPALAGRYLLLRSHREAVLFELPLASGG